MGTHTRSACLYVATILGDLLIEDLVVGGLVPSLLIVQGSLRSAPEAEAALDILREDLTEPAMLGPTRVARSDGDETDDAVRQDVVGFVPELLGEVDRIAGG